MESLQVHVEQFKLANIYTMFRQQGNQVTYHTQITILKL